jgi:methyltransferase (TIGR00027 family)
LFADPYAARFLDAAGFPAAQPGKRDFVAIMVEQVAVRTRFLDDALIAATTGGCRQVVLVASGMDSRAWRLDWPAGTELFELDQGGVLRFKDDVMASEAPRCVRHAVAVDLRADWSAGLLEAGFRADRPTTWLVEGLLYSMDEVGADGLLAAMTTLSVPGSSLAFDHIPSGPALLDALDAMHPGLVGLWQPGPADPAAWLRRHGWRPDLHELASVAPEYGRVAHPAVADAWLGRALLVG